MIIGKKKQENWTNTENNNMYREAKHRFDTNKYTKTFIEKSEYCDPNKRMEIRETEKRPNNVTS